MEIVTIRKAMDDLSRLIAKACRGEEIVIARGRTPIVRLVALRDAQAGANRELYTTS